MIICHVSVVPNTPPTMAHIRRSAIVEIKTKYEPAMFVIEFKMLNFRKFCLRLDCG